MKKPIEQLLRNALVAAKSAGALQTETIPAIPLEVPKDPAFGDVATTVALQLAKVERKAPRMVAEQIIAHIDDPDGLVEQVEIAGPGYINCRYSQAFWQRMLAAVDSDSFGPQTFGTGKRILVEFVSANPTGPLTVGHGRNAVLGDAIARLYEATGHEVTREYYFNNAGRQMKVLGESVQARYLEQIGQPSTFPEGGYQGDYIGEIAATLVTEHGETLRDADASGPFKAAAETAIFADIKQTLERMRIAFDEYFNEDSLYTGGQIDAFLAELRARDLAFDDDGAVWLRGEQIGLDKDRVLVKSSGEPAYRLPDMAYHKNKLDRGFDLLVDVLGADHIAENKEVISTLQAVGLDAEKIKAIIYQFVTLTRGGEQVKMSTRRAEYVTVDELLDEVGRDVVRFMFLTRKADSHLEFDIELAKKQSADNPVFYVQYAYARICSVEKQATEAGIHSLPAAESHLDRLTAPEERALVRLLAQYPDIVEDAARMIEPHRVVFYLIELASEFHRFYNRHRVLTDDPALSQSRWYLCHAVRVVVRKGLQLLGVDTPETM